MKFPWKYFTENYNTLFDDVGNVGSRTDLINKLRQRVFSLPTIFFLAITSALIISISIGLDLDWGEMFVNIREMSPIDYMIGLCLY